MARANFAPSQYALILTILSTCWRCGAKFAARTCSCIVTLLKGVESSGSECRCVVKHSRAPVAKPLSKLRVAAAWL